LAGFLAAAFAVAALGGIATASSVQSWYPTLAKPTWTPPPWLFGPAWTLLYTAMSVAAWRVWRSPATTGRACTLRLWWLQLALNATWSWAFFYYRLPAAGLPVIAALLALLIWLQFRIARTDTLAASLWVPYVLWVSFASALNFAIWKLN